MLDRVQWKLSNLETQLLTIFATGPLLLLRKSRLAKLPDNLVSDSFYTYSKLDSLPPSSQCYSPVTKRRR